MPAAAAPHLNALLFQLRDRRCGGCVLMNLRPPIVRAGANEPWMDGRALREAQRYMAEDGIK